MAIEIRPDDKGRHRGVDAAIDAYRAMQTGKLEGRAVIVPTSA
jgi:hypothetical protein